MPTTGFPIWTRLSRREMRASRRLYAGGGFVYGICGAHGGYDTAEVCDVRRIGRGCGLCEGPGKIVMGCFLDDLRAFGINADQWTTAAQDEREWRRSAEQGA